MIINFFAIPDILTQEVDKGKTSIIDIAKYVQEAYQLDEEESPKIDQENLKNSLSNPNKHLEIYYRPIFIVIEKIYEIYFNSDYDIPIIGRQPFTDEEAEILLNEYVTYSGGFLTFEDIKYLNGKLSDLSFDDFLEGALKKDHSKKLEDIKSIKIALGFSEEEIIEILPFLREDYDEFTSYIAKLAHFEGKEKLGLFISID